MTRLSNDFRRGVVSLLRRSAGYILSQPLCCCTALHKYSRAFPDEDSYLRQAIVFMEMYAPTLEEYVRLNGINPAHYPGLEFEQTRNEQLKTFGQYWWLPAYRAKPLYGMDYLQRGLSLNEWFDEEDMRTQEERCLFLLFLAEVLENDES